MTRCAWLPVEVWDTVTVLGCGFGGTFTVTSVRVEPSALTTASVMKRDVPASAVSRSLWPAFSDPPSAGGLSARTCWCSGWQSRGWVPEPQTWVPRKTSSRPWVVNDTSKSRNLLTLLPGGALRQSAWAPVRVLITMILACGVVPGPVRGGATITATLDPSDATAIGPTLTLPSCPPGI